MFAATVSAANGVDSRLGVPTLAIVGMTPPHGYAAHMNIGHVSWPPHLYDGTHR